MTSLYTAEQNLRDMFLLAHVTEQVLTNYPIAGTVLSNFRCPLPCTIVRMDVVYNAETGTTPALTVTLRRVTTAILSAIATTAATMASDAVVETNQSLDCDTGESLNLFGTTVADDNDFAGLSIQVWAVRR
jgi:hypothetical protein